MRPHSEAPRWLAVEGAHFYGAVALGNGSQFTVGCIRIHAGAIAVGIEGHGFYMFGGYAKSHYVAKKLSIPPGDAGNMADFINAQVGCAQMAREQGEYRERFCFPPLAEMFRDYFNNFLSIDGFAEHYGLRMWEASQIISEGRKLHEAGVAE